MKRRWEPYIDSVFLLGLFVMSYFLFFHRLGGIGMLGPDEPRYAAIARGMFQSGDYITPRLNGEPWFEKPVLFYWLGALGYKIFGLNEWGARFPSAFAATVTIFLIYWCGRKIWNRSIGFLAALILASSVGFFAFARAASTDMPLTACLTAALVFFVAGLNDGTTRRRTWFYLFYLALGLGVLAKGPVALLLPAISLIGFLAVRGSWDEWRTWHPEGIMIALAVSLPWYIACTWVNGFEFIRVFIIGHNLERFATTIYGHQHPFYFYLPVLLLLTFPWTFLIIPTFRRHFSRTEQFLMWWSIVPFAFFSLSASKLPGYILPMVPPIALLCARELAVPSSRTFKIAVFIEAGTMAFIGVGFGFFNTMINVDPHVSGMLIAIVAFSLAVILSVIAIWLSPLFLAAVNASAIMAVVVVATNMVFPRFDVSDTMRPWERALEQIVPRNQMILLYKPTRSMEYGLQYYRFSNARGIGSPEELARALPNHSRVLCIAEDKSLDELARNGSVDMEVVHTIGNQTAFWVWSAK
jgi:4-amino-4-deoxy-L-arabinose transferase-like glycosyltransferase